MKIILFMLFLLFYPLFAKENINVLFLSSFHSNMPWSKELLKGINSGIKNQENYKFNLYTHYFDTLRLGNNEDLNVDFRYFQERYKNIKINLVISDSFYANRFINLYYKKLFQKDTPIIYLADGNEKLNLISTQYKFTKNKVFLAQKTFETARKIYKNATNVVILNDNDIIGQEIEDKIRELSKKEKLKVITLKNLSYKEYEQRVKNLNSNTILFFIILSKDTKGENRIPKDEAIILSRISPIPIFTFHSSFVTGDVLGGYIMSPYTMGKNSISLAVDYLTKKKFGEYNSYKALFNENSILKYKISKDLFPKEASFINIKKKFWHEYPKETIYLSLLIFSLLVFICVLAIFAKKLFILNREIKIKNSENIKNLEIIQQQAKLASMGEMIGAIAHQWRQPLNEISSRIQNIKYDYMDGFVTQAYIDEFVQRSKETVQFMSQTIDDFRNFFRIDKIKIAFDAKEAIEEIVKLQNTQLKNHNIEIKIIGNSLKIEGFKSEFKQVILTIINNAKDALIENSIAKPKILIKISAKEVSIIDNAGGIKKEIENRIFEPYFTTKSEGNGIGMGLYIAKMIIENNLQGVLSFENVHQGSKFTIAI